MKKIKKILFSQPKPSNENSPFIQLKDKYNVKIDFFPLIKSEEIHVSELQKQQIRISDFTAVILMSKIAVDNFFRIAKEYRFTIPNSYVYICKSEAISNYIRKYTKYRSRCFHVLKNGSLDDLKNNENIKLKDKKYLLPTSDISKELLSKINDLNINCEPIKLYKTVPNTEICDKVSDINEYDMLVFFSHYDILALKEIFPKFKKKDTIVIAYGHNTQIIAKKKKLKTDIEIPSPEFPSIIGGIEHYLKK